MKYKRAELIRALVEDLNSSFDADYFRAAIVQNHPNEDSYSVHLFSASGTTWPLCELATFATSIEKLTCNVTVRLAHYDRGTTELDMVQSVQIL
mgnify:CR=1 FL=1